MRAGQTVMVLVLVLVLSRDQALSPLHRITTIMDTIIRLDLVLGLGLALALANQIIRARHWHLE